LVVAVIGLLGVALSAHPSPAATITIVNQDGPNEGFNDPTPKAPVGGNPGTTVGAQRLFVFQYAANIWGSILQSPIQILVTAQFNAQACDTFSGVLGSTSPTTVARDFTGAPFSGTWYHIALANKIAGSDLTTAADMSSTFNSSVGGSACLPMGWYYGVDGNEGGQIELLPVVIHELGHGLGFSTTTNGSTGSQLNGFPHVWDHFLLDTATGLHWYQESNGQRSASAISCGKLVWDGRQVTAHLPSILTSKLLLHVNTPAGVAGDYTVGTADFGPPLTEPGVTGDVVLANDGSGTVTDACEPLVNVVAGKIVLVDRGTCTFTQKVKNAQNAGAIAVIVADNAAGCPPADMGGSDPTITISSVRISQTDGNALKANLAGQNASMLRDFHERAGADAAGHALLYTPNPYQSGSSVSHWDTSMEPNALMEPGINSDLSSGVDLTPDLLADIGWGTATAVESQGQFDFALSQNAPNPGSDITSIRFSVPARGSVALRVFDVSGRLVATLIEETLGPGPHTATLQTSRLAAGVYYYRLEAIGKSLARRLVVLPQ
jgi:PA domain/Secretion system C-terminal sorting domain